MASEHEVVPPRSPPPFPGYIPPAPNLPPLVLETAVPCHCPSSRSFQPLAIQLSTSDYLSYSGQGWTNQPFFLLTGVLKITRHTAQMDVATAHILHLRQLGVAGINSLLLGGRTREWRGEGKRGRNKQIAFRDFRIQIDFFAGWHGDS